MRLPITGLSPYYLTDVEVARYTSDSGDQLVIVDPTAGLETLREVSTTINGRWYDLLHVQRDGESFWIYRDPDRRGSLARQSSKGDDGTRVITYRRAEYPSSYGSATEEDLRVVLGDESAVAARRQQLEERMQAAEDAIAGRGYTREAYEEACAASGVPALSDEEISEAAYALHAYLTITAHTVDSVIVTDLAAARLRAMEAEADAADARALQAATQAAGSGPYDRDAYERACRAAGQEPLDDQQAAALGTAYLDQAAARASGGGLVVGAPDRATTQIRLALRRMDGMQAETPDHTCHACRRWLAPGEAMMASLALYCPDCYSAQE